MIVLSLRPLPRETELRQIKAFVGHSFNEVDQHVVGTVLALLNRVKQLHSNFGWEHATEPEAEQVREKVLRLFEDKNLFIAICTRHECAVKPNVLRALWNWQYAHTGAYEWKPSDWVIQEIGLAIGRGMPVVLLLENGVRRPGALQSDLEYIPFNRNSPEAVADKLLGMLAKILRPSGSTESETHESSLSPPKSDASQAERDTVGKSEGGDILEPRENWSAMEYRIGYWYALYSDKREAAEKIRQSFLASTHAEREDNRRRFCAWVETARIETTNGGSMATLERLVSEAGNDSEAIEYLANALDYYNEWAKAASQYERAASHANTMSTRARLLEKAATSYRKSGDDDAASALAERMRVTDADPEAAYAIAKGNAAIFEKETELVIASYEYMLESRQDDHATRFELAYKYSQGESDELACYHYSLIPQRARSGGAWNNMGVSQEAIGLPINSVDSYREARGKGETLAAANIANKFLKAGFVDEAMDILRDASKVDSHHPNVDRGLAQAKEAREGEDKKQQKALDQARPTSDFYRHVGRALTRPTPSNMNGTWKSPKAQLLITVDEGQFKALGTYEAKYGLLANLLAGSGSSSVPPTTMVEEFGGTLRGGVVVGGVKREKQGEIQRKSGLQEAADEPKIVMWLSDDGLTLNVREVAGTNEAFYSIVRST